MLWSVVHDTFLDAVDSLPAFISEIDDFSVPALGKWDAAGLSGHLIRAIRAPVRYLAEPEPSGVDAPDAATYYLGYLKWRDADPAAADASVATRGYEELDGLNPDRFAGAFTMAAASARAALQGIQGERRVATPFGTLRISDYLRTRTLEVVVHGIDLSRATGVTWQPPDHALSDSLILLTELARATHRAGDLLMLLTGREGIATSNVLPVLR